MAHIRFHHIKNSDEQFCSFQSELKLMTDKRFLTLSIFNIQYHKF